jgi:hypothetical protein
MQYTPIYARALDAVKLDACGAPVTGSASYFAIVNDEGASDALIRVRLSPDYYTPSDIVQENGAGRRKVNRKGTPQLQGFTVRLEVSGVAPAIEAALCGDRVLKTDAGAPTVGTGVIAGSRVAAPPGWSIRLFQDVDSDACSGSGIPSIIHWLAAVRQWKRAGDYELQNGVTVSVFEGYAGKNGEYDTGPFDDAASAWSAVEIWGYDYVEDVTLPDDTAGELLAWPLV